MKRIPALAHPDPERRRWLQTLAAAPMMAGAAGAPGTAGAAIKTSARIVIAGSGLGGIAVANRLARMLDGAKITIVDRKEEHNYQPGYTLVATGVGTIIDDDKAAVKAAFAAFAAEPKCSRPPNAIR